LFERSKGVNAWTTKVVRFDQEVEWTYSETARTQVPEEHLARVAEEKQRVENKNMRRGWGGDSTAMSGTHNMLSRWIPRWAGSEDAVVMMG
jgi:hypothetical protein